MGDEAPLPADAGAPPARPGPRLRWRDVGALGGVLGIILALIAVLWSSTRSRPAGEDVAAFAVVRATPPSAAPDLALTDVAGRPVRLASFRGRVVFLNFWASWCEPCRREIPAMEALGRDLGPRGLVLVTVNYREDAGVAQRFAREIGLAAPVLLDPDGAVARRYRVPGLPASFFVDRGGRLVGEVLGYRDWESAAARAYIEDLLGRGAG